MQQYKRHMERNKVHCSPISVSSTTSIHKLSTSTFATVIEPTWKLTLTRTYIHVQFTRVDVYRRQTRGVTVITCQEVVGVTLTSSIVEYLALFGDFVKEPSLYISSASSFYS